MKKTFLLVVVCLATFALQAQKVDISLNLKKGATYQSKSVSIGEITQEVMGQSIKIDMEITGVMAFTVTNQLDNAFEIDGKYVSLVMNMKMPQTTMTFSSETPDSQDPLSSMLAKMTQRSFQFTLSKKGEVLAVKNLDVLMDSALSEIGDLPAVQKEQLMKQLSDSYGEDAFRGSMGTMLTIFPDHPVAVGDSWKSSLALKSGMTMDVAMTYTFKGEEGGFYLISGEGTMATPEGGSPVVSNGMQMSFEMSGSMVSDLKLDKKTGWVMAGTSEQQMTGKTKVAPTDQLPNGMDIPMTMKTTSTYTGN
ncbi:DUF6263 family protein [Mangrovibacterium diazotrophicum]|uniref:DUF4412 domain-containing protein n=1 Tax=Mangrovibacterium diazotrophicum TaxID=1261403 RepID=A0A419W895_9BACT|nr:DUF6263 family protein [Mangrovibacterium diazotrophicum]RKD91674.1 hypothetical protein BC643_2036 [Mangrovibacterium diazotrophicum]